MDINKTCCFTGKRPQSLPFGFNEKSRGCIELKNKISEQIEAAIAEGYTTFISGMALGVDLWAAEEVLKIKGKYPLVELVCALPYKAQSSSWSAEYRERYMICIHNCAKYVVVSPAYTKDCFFKRNMYMVDNSSLVIAVCDNPPTGGTAHTINYAERKGRKIILIDY